MSSFVTKLVVRLLDDEEHQGRGWWELVSPLKYQSARLFGAIITVPKGFKTDFASVPRVPIAFLLCGDTSHPAAVLHDFLYTSPHPVATREIADELLREAAMASGVPKWRAWMLWVGVRIGGASHWD